MIKSGVNASFFSSLSELFEILEQNNFVELGVRHELLS